MSKNSSRREMLKRGGIVGFSSVIGSNMVQGAPSQEDSRDERTTESKSDDQTIFENELTVINHSIEEHDFNIEIRRGENGQSDFSDQVTLNSGANPDGSSDWKKNYTELGLQGGRYNVVVEVDSDIQSTKSINLSKGGRDSEQLYIRLTERELSIGISQA